MTQLDLFQDIVIWFRAGDVLDPPVAGHVLVDSTQQIVHQRDQFLDNRIIVARRDTQPAPHLRCEPFRIPIGIRPVVLFQLL